MIGISMALTIALCVAGFSVIYAALDDTVGDFVARDVPAPVIPTQPPTEPAVAQADDAPETEEPVIDAPVEEPEEAEPESAATEAPAEEAEPTEDPDAFTPDFQSPLDVRLNFRSEPATDREGETVIEVIDGGTLLQFTGETQASEDPEDGEDGEDGWMLFELEDGQEGWLRAIDVEEFEP